MPARVDQVWGDNFNNAVKEKLRQFQPQPAQQPPRLTIVAPRPVRLTAEEEWKKGSDDTYDDLVPAKWWNIFIIVAIASIIILLISLHCKVSKLCMMQAALLASGGGHGGGGRPGLLQW